MEIENARINQFYKRGVTCLIKDVIYEKSIGNQCLRQSRPHAVFHGRVQTSYLS